MPTVELVRPTGKDRFQLVFADGEKISLPGVVLARFKLTAGKKISERERTKIRSEISFQRGYEQALRLLSYRPRSRREIVNRLRQKKVEPDQTEKIITKLQDQSLLSDEEFARWWVDQRVRFRPRSRRKLVAELAQKGVGRSLAQVAVAKVDEEKMIACLLAKKVVPDQSLSEPEKQKISQWLMRQGFGWEVVKKALSTFK